MEKKRILFASKDLSIGGMEKALVSLLNSFDFGKYNVTLVLENRSGELLPSLDKRVSVIEYKVSKLSFVLLRKAINLLNRMSFKKKYGGKFDFSCCYATYSKPCEVVSKLASENSMLYIHSNYVAKDGEKGAVEFLDYMGIGGFKKVAFVSESSRLDTEKLYPGIKERFVTIGNLIDGGRIKELSDENCPDAECAEDRTTFVFAGRIDNTSKKLHRLVDAAVLFEKKGIPFEIRIIGDGPDRAETEEYVKSCGMDKNIVFYGAKTNPYPYMKNAAALILVSDYEGFPVVYGEAAVLGKSVITTVPAADGYLTVDKFNSYIAEKNAESVAAAMYEFCNEKNKRVIRCDYTEVNRAIINDLNSKMED